MVAPLLAAGIGSRPMASARIPVTRDRRKPGAGAGFSRKRDGEASRLAGGGVLASRVVIVTGAAQGIGAATSRKLIGEDACVLLADVQVEPGRALAKELGPRAAFCPLDVRDEHAWTEVVDVAIDSFGTIDGLVNNAGVLRLGDLETLETRDFMDVLEVNVLGTFLGIRSVAEVMKSRGRGVVVNISSTAAMTGANRTIAYTSSKWAVRGLTKAAAAELGADGIRVNSVHPGPTETAMNPVDRDRPDDWSVEYPLGRIGQPEDVANMVAFLLSDESAYCTGAEFVVDGGRSNCTLVRRFAGDPDWMTPPR